MKTCYGVTPLFHCSCTVSIIVLNKHALKVDELNVPQCCVFQAEPSFKSQLWRTVRTLLLTFLLLSGLGALIEDKAMPRGVLNNPDLKPLLKSTTRFEDVKGVDEAKVGKQECNCRA